jgi:competence protein ComEA
MRPSWFFTFLGLILLLALPATAQTTAPPKSASPTTAPQPSTPEKPRGELVDINSASAEELDKLPGVGPVRAKAIIANRPYNGKDDLTNRKIIPENVYNEIKEKIIARQGPTK